MREEVRLDHGAYAPSRTELPTDVMRIGYSRHEKIPPGNPPAFESDGSGCRTGDRQVSERKTSCRTEDTVREGNVPPEFSPVMIRITAMTEVRLRIFFGNFPGNKAENKRENARAFSLRFFPVILLRILSVDYNDVFSLDMELIFYVVYHVRYFIKSVLFVL